MDLHLSSTSKFSVINAGAAPAGASLAPAAPAACLAAAAPPAAGAAAAAAATAAPTAAPASAAAADELADEISALEAQITKKGAEIKTLKVRHLPGFPPCRPP